MSIVGNFAGGGLSRRFGYRRASAFMFIGLAASIFGAFVVPREFAALAWFWLPLGGFFGGVFGLFTMYLPPLFPPSSAPRVRAFATISAAMPRRLPPWFSAGRSPKAISASS